MIGFASRTLLSRWVPMKVVRPVRRRGTSARRSTRELTAVERRRSTRRAKVLDQVVHPAFDLVGLVLADRLVLVDRQVLVLTSLVDFVGHLFVFGHTSPLG